MIGNILFAFFVFLAQWAPPSKDMPFPDALIKCEIEGEDKYLGLWMQESFRDYASFTHDDISYGFIVPKNENVCEFARLGVESPRLQHRPLGDMGMTDE